MTDAHREALRTEFERAAPIFAERTRSRFDQLDVVAFTGLKHVERAIEVGGGTGNFLSKFEDVADELIAVDLTEGMLREARARFQNMKVVLADGTRLPFASRSVDLTTCAQMLHHVWEPLPLLKELRRVTTDRGKVLVVDQVSTESYEQAAFMTQLEAIRDPSHAVSRPPSALKVIVKSAGLEIEDVRVVESEQRISTWMAPGEFPEDRFAMVDEFITKFGPETGMGFTKDADEWVFTRRRAMILARR